MKHTNHAEEVAKRFRELVEDAGDTLADSHYNELSLLIEASIDTALVERLEKMADRMEKFAREIRHDAEFFE